ncbi:MAG TPA: tautomerase family protein [Anaeromyxobacteraceae bacterium]|nr:tautomerase family protein [Anaeromyxobacteraceae bacterium]
MPLVHVHLLAGRTPAQKKAILDGVHTALVEAFRIPEHDRFQLLHEHAAEGFEARYGEETVLVEATVFPGRTLDAKRKLYQAIARNLEGAGVPRDRVLIVLHEPPMENWGIRGGQAACDVQLGFKVDV